MPVKGDQLVAAGGEVWVVVRCHSAGDGPRLFAVDLIQQQDLKHTSRPVSLNWDEFEDFCRKKGITYPSA
jgi:hypothetical protein